MTTHNSIKKLDRARKLLNAGKLREAKSVLDKYCRRPHAGIQGWMMLASVNGQLGLMEDVVVACDRILAQQPNAAVAFSHKANALVALNRHHDAIPCYRKAIELEPGNAAILNNYGQALCLSNRNDESIPLFQEAIKQQPNYAAAHYNLANALSDTLKYSEAIAHYLEALRLAPGIPGIHLRLAFAYQETAQLEAAEAFFRQALDSPADREGAYPGLAVVLRYQGKLEEALSVYSAASEEFKDNTNFVAGMADVYERNRQRDKALEVVRALRQRKEPLKALALDVLCRVCIEFDCCEDALAQGDRVLKDPSLSTSDQITAHHALGKLLDKLGDYGNAFRHFEQANRLSDYKFDAEANRQTVDDQIRAFRKEQIPSLTRASIRSERPLFIVGMPRSGTTLTEQIIASHPQAYGAGELIQISWAAAQLKQECTAQGGYPDCLKSISQGRMDSLATSYLEYIRGLSGDALRVVDKMPHNFRHLGLIQLLFPRARIIHCMRNPLDTCLSIYFQSFNRAHSYSTDLDHLAEFYSQYQRLMQHWKSVLSIPILDVRYEELVAKQEETSRNLIRFCGLDWDDRCLSFHRSERAVSTASYNQVNQPIYRGSMERWKNYREYIGPLLPLLESDEPALSHQSAHTLE